MLLHLPGILTPDELARLRGALDTAEWTDGRETVGPQGARAKRNEQLPESSPLRAELGQVVLAALKRNPDYFNAALPLKTSTPRFNRYSGGGEYGFHVDGAMMRSNDGYVRSDLSCTLFLCDPSEYEGGELVVHDTYGEHEVKLPAGDLILYPSSSLHRVAPVTRGARLASFLWIQSMVRDDARRQTLFDLDLSIRQLGGGDAGNHPAILRLTGIYHNLLRRWADS